MDSDGLEGELFFPFSSPSPLDMPVEGVFFFGGNLFFSLIECSDGRTGGFAVSEG